jgi:hypothetical protein
MLRIGLVAAVLEAVVLFDGGGVGPDAGEFTDLSALDSSENSKASRIKTGERSGGIWENLFRGGLRK